MPRPHLLLSRRPILGRSRVNPAFSPDSPVEEDGFEPSVPLTGCKRRQGISDWSSITPSSTAAAANPRSSAAFSPQRSCENHPSPKPRLGQISHRPPSAHRFPARSFFGGFPTPAPYTGVDRWRRAGIQNPYRKAAVRRAGEIGHACAGFRTFSEKATSRLSDLRWRLPFRLPLHVQLAFETRLEPRISAVWARSRKPSETPVRFLLWAQKCD